MGEKGQCAKGGYCVNVAEVREAIGKSWAELHGGMKLNASKIDDLRREVADIPHQVTEAIREERVAAKDRFKRGEGHFDELFTRLNSLERKVLILWIIVVLLGLGNVGKFALWIIPIVGSWFIP